MSWNAVLDWPYLHYKAPLGPPLGRLVGHDVGGLGGGAVRGSGGAGGGAALGEGGTPLCTIWSIPVSRDTTDMKPP